MCGLQDWRAITRALPSDARHVRSAGTRPRIADLQSAHTGRVVVPRDVQTERREQTASAIDVVTRR